LDATAQILEIILLFYAKRQSELELLRQKQQLFNELTEKAFPGNPKSSSPLTPSSPAWCNPST